jgi:hypothetical protein
MRYEMVPITTQSELEEAIKIQYGIEVNIANLFFKNYGFHYNCGLITFSEDDIVLAGYLAEKKSDENSQYLCVLNYLHDTVYKDTSFDFIYVLEQ